MLAIDRLIPASTEKLTMDSVGFIGLGTMGLPMAERLIAGGHPLVVHDVRSVPVEALVKKGALPAVGLQDLADRCEIIVFSLPSLEAVRSVLLPADAFAGRRLRVLVNTSTTGATLAGEIASAAARHGVQLMDCPISGGARGAIDGTLSVFASGNSDAFERVKPLLLLWGSAVHYVGGRPGVAQTLKLINNLLGAVSLIATSEVLVMGAKAGLAPAAMLDAINGGLARNGATLVLFPQSILPRTFDFGAPIDMLMKDVDLAIQEGEALGIPMWVCQAARLVGKHAQFAGLGDNDMTTLIKVIEDGAHFQLPRV